MNEVLLSQTAKFFEASFDANYEVTTKYYEYKVNIIIPAKDAKIPGKKNEKLSTEEYIVISLYFDIADSERSNGYIVKNIDLIEE